MLVRFPKSENPQIRANHLIALSKQQKHEKKITVTTANFRLFKEKL
jgi:hypothetical protein